MSGRPPHRDNAAVAVGEAVAVAASEGGCQGGMGQRVLMLAFCPFSALSATPQVLTLMKEIKDTLNKGQE